MDEERVPFGHFYEGYFCALFVIVSTGILRFASHKKLVGFSNTITHEGRVSAVWSVLWGRQGVIWGSNLFLIFK